MTGLQRFIAGGLGGIAQLVFAFILADKASILAQITIFVVIFYFTKLMVYFAVGGGWAWLRKTEQDPWILFQLGMIGPLMLTSLIQSQRADAQKVAYMLDLIPPAYAAQIETMPIDKFTVGDDVTIIVHKFTRPVAGNLSEQFSQGWGLGVPRNWYVVVAAANDPEQLAAPVQQLRKHYPFWFDRCRVYRRKTEQHYEYILTIDYELDEAAATKVKDRAVSEGVTSAYLFAAKEADYSGE